MLNKSQIKNNIDWLLKNSSLPVRYLTYKNLLEQDPRSIAMLDLFDQVKQCNIVKEIFSKQEKDGSWCSSGSWATRPTMRKSGYTPVSPKYVTTSWILPILGDIGFTIQDKRIKKACDYILSYQLDNGFITEIHSDKFDIPIDLLPVQPCRFSIMLIGLGKVGGDIEPIVKKAYNVLLKWQREDGGWVSEQHLNQRNWTRSCPYASYHATMALYCTGNRNYEKALKKALKFLVNHLSTKMDNEIQRFFYHGHSLVHELLMFSEYNIGLNHKVVQILLNWLMSMYQPNDYYFKYKGKRISKYTYKSDYMDTRVAKYRLFHLIEDDWLTYYATKIMNNILVYKQ